MDRIKELSELTAQALRLERDFNQTPRLFDPAAWEKLIQGYEAIGATANATHWAGKLANAATLIEMEFTPDKPGDRPWQLEGIEVREAPDHLLYWVDRKDIE
jgi:hypothetical protein